MEFLRDPQVLPSFVLDYQFLSDFDESLESQLNGLTLNNTYMPDEVVLQILSYVEPRQVLKYSLVCRKWNRLIKSFAYWSTVYKRHFKQREPKKLPWYVYYCLFSTDYFDTNLIKNGNGENGFEHWRCDVDGNHFVIEDIPKGSHPKPKNVPEFKGKTSCFATSSIMGTKLQTVSLKSSDLFSHIVNCYKPHIYLSEWTTATFDCSSAYKLSCLIENHKLSNLYLRNHPCAVNYVEQWARDDWKKIELVVKEYPEPVDRISLLHVGRGDDTQFNSGWHGSKMAGAVMKFLFDTIEPLLIGDDNKMIPKRFSKFEYTASTGLSKEKIDQIYNFLINFDHDDDDNYYVHYDSGSDDN